MRTIPFPQMPSEDELAESWRQRQVMHRADPNCITHWYPRIKDHVPTPRTEIVRLDLTYERDQELWAPLDGGPMPEWWPEWVKELQAAARRLSETGPWFLRTGVFSGKHDWHNNCAVADLGLIGEHAYNIFHTSQIVDPFGLPYHVWAVREWLPGPSLCEYERFSGMPLRREFRAFAEGGEVLCIHPYWPPDALDESVTSRPEFVAMNELGADEAAVHELAAAASRQVEGAWSIDCLWTEWGWYVTDMAVADRSYHWPGCPNAAPRDR